MTRNPRVEASLEEKFEPELKILADSDTFDRQLEV